MIRIEHITKENGKWFVELYDDEKYVGPNYMRVHSGDLYGWEGLAYRDLCGRIARDFGISLPAVSSMKLIKKTKAREIYVKE